MVDWKPGTLIYYLGSGNPEYLYNFISTANRPGEWMRDTICYATIIMSSDDHTDGRPPGTVDWPMDQIHNYFKLHTDIFAEDEGV